MTSSQRIGRWWQWWFAGYLVLVGTVVGAMLWTRQSVLSDSSPLTSKSDWQEWRNDVTKQAKTGPVERRVPKSEEPPVLVLMRDNFGVMMTGAILFSSLLYWIMAWFITGMLKSR